MKTLYLTDLDGTLLDKDSRLSDFSRETINRLIQKGMLFSYATARSLSSASVVTDGLRLKLPVIVHNGTFLADSVNGEIKEAVTFTPRELLTIRGVLRKYGIYPLVYSFIEGKQRVSWLREKENKGISFYIQSRQGDPRLRCVGSEAELYAGENFYFTCIGTQAELAPVYIRLKAELNCIFQKELYRPEFWCEILPRGASKANAAKRLTEWCGSHRLVVFGDALNDMPMFEAGDESYAPENAVEQVRRAATGLIPSNERDGVAHWLLENAVIS